MTHCPFISRGTFRLCAWIALLAALLGAPAKAEMEPARGEAGSVGEYEVKAAFLFNFARFTTWPGDGERTDALRVCVAGRDPFGSLLDATLRDKQVRGRGFLVDRHELTQDLRGCDIVFVGDGPVEERRRLLESLEGEPILTVGDSEEFAREGGIVGFYRQRRRIRFAVNLDAIGRTELKVSSKLLQLASVLRETP